MYHCASDATSEDDHFDERNRVAQARAGDSNAFNELYERHLPKILRTTYRMLRNKEDAEDAAQRSFQRAFSNLQRFRGESTFSTWLTRIAINEALMMLRRRRTDQRLFESDTHDEVESPVLRLADKGPTPEESLAANERRIVVMQAISKLRKNLRTVVVLGEFHGLSSAEIAAKLGVTVAAVKARIFHARRRLRGHLGRKLQAAPGGLL